ncbi:MAG: acyl carrier protein [Porticoccaceae bacterium]|nr:acyl carrier protein [Porticoccaceae bacterium]
MNELEQELKQLIIDTLDLEDIAVADIDSHEALFVEGLGLDSIDALELGLALQKRYGVKGDADSEQIKIHFACVHNLALFVNAQTSTQADEKGEH